MVTKSKMQRASVPQSELVVCMGGYGGCYGPPRSGLPLTDIDFFSKINNTSDKIKGKEIAHGVYNF